MLGKARRLSDKDYVGVRKSLPRSEPGNPGGVKWIDSARTMVKMRIAGGCKETI